MSHTYKKYSYKYEFLKLELQDFTDQFDEYNAEWKSIFGKYFNNIKTELWVNESTGEIRKDKPDNSEIAKQEKNIKIKKLYRKVCVKAHPDKGGSLEEFNIVKDCYDKNDYLGLISYATENNIEVELSKEDIDLLDNSCTQLQDKIKNVTNSLVYKFFTGNDDIKNAVIKQLEFEYKVKINEKEILDKLDTN